MKHKFSKMGRVAIALVLALSLSLVMAVPASATIDSISYTDLTEPGQTIALSSAPMALFKVVIDSSDGSETLDKVRMDFESIDEGDFVEGDLDAVSVYSDADLTAVIPGSLAWVGLAATVTFTDPVALSAGTNEFWVAIETSATISDGDDFQASLSSNSLYIDATWTGTSIATTYTITADATAPTIVEGELKGSTLGDDKITITFNEAVVAVDGDWTDGNEFATIKSPTTTALDLTNADFAIDVTNKILTITLDYATDGDYLFNGDYVAVTPSEGKITDLVGNVLVDTEVVGTTNAIGGDDRDPMVAAEDIVGTINVGVDDTIAITFSEDTRGDWTAVETDSIVKGDLTIESPDGNSLDLTNAGFVYVAATKTLTITLDFANDGDYLVNGDFVKVAPASGALTDMAGNAVDHITPVEGTTPNSGDAVAPTISSWAFKIGTDAYTPATDRPLKDLDELIITVTFSEAMADSPTVSIVDAADNLIQDAGVMAEGVDRTEWTYTFAVADGDGDGIATITASGTDMAGNALASDATATFTIDNTHPTIPDANIIGAVLAGNDTITITFSEDTRGDWTAVETDSIVKGDLTIESPDGNSLDLTNAGFVYVAATKTLTITLDFANDGDYLVNGDDVEVTPTTALTDMAGNTMATAAVTGTTLIGAIVPAEVWVDDDATEGWYAIPTNFELIQNAINAVAEDGTVNVLPGLYDNESFPLDLNKDGVTLQSTAGPDDTTIDGSGSVETSVIEITAADVVLGGIDSGFTIKGHIDNALASGGAVVFSGASCTNPTVQGNTIISTQTHQISRGIFSHRDSGFNSNVIIKDNTITSTATEPYGAEDGGMYLFLGPGSLIDNNEVSGFLDGISLYGITGAVYPDGWANPITVSNNNLHNNTCSGIGLDGTPAWAGPLNYIVVSGNDLYLNYDGISMWGAELDYIEVSGNTLYSNTNANVSLLSDVTEENVDIFDNNYGIELETGWNFISVPKKMAEASDTFGELLTGVNWLSVYSYEADPAAADYGWTEPAADPNTPVQVLEAYWIKTSQAGTIILSYADTGQQVPPTKPLTGDAWNAIGFSDIAAALAEDTLMSIDGSWSTVIGWDAETQAYETAIISPGGEDMNPFKGYWIWVTQDDVLAAISG